MQGTCRQDVWIVDGICMVAYFQDFQFKRASRSHAKTGLFSMVFSVFFFRLFLEGFFSSFFEVLGGFEGPKGGHFWHIS